MLSALFTGTGTVVEKIALQRLPDVHARRFWAMIRTLCSSSQWLWGCLLLLGGLVCQGLALSLAPISVAQPIFASGIVLLLVLSHFVLHDHLRKVEWSALATIVVALVLLGLSVDTHVDRAGATVHLGLLPAGGDPDRGRRALRLRRGRPRPQHGRRVKQLRAPLFGLAAGLLYGVAGLGLKSASTYVQRYGLFGSVPHLLVSPELYVARRRHGDRSRALPDRPAALLGLGRLTGEHRHLDGVRDRSRDRAVQRAPAHRSGSR